MQDIICAIQNDLKVRYKNRGVVAIKKWGPTEDELRVLIQNCVYYIQFNFHKITSEFEAGCCPLTAVLMGCGEEVRRSIGLDDENTPEFKELLASMGAVIIHNLASEEYIAVDRSGKSLRAKWYVQALDKWLTLGESMSSHITREFHYLTPTKPENISSHKHPYNRRRVIKGGSPELFDELLGTDHLTALSTLQQTPLRINRQVLSAVQAHKWKNKIPVIPKAGSKALVDILYYRLSKDISVQEEYNVAAAAWEVKRKALKTRSNVMERLLTISKANSLLYRKQFYNIMELDYRGRMYYAEPYIHYQGNDIMKGLLEFSEGREVDERGLFWLKAQAATSFNPDFTKKKLAKMDWTEIDYIAELEKAGLDDISLDKMSLADRVRWVDNSMPFIRRVVEVGLIHKTAAEPVLFLATCIEICATIDAQRNGKPHFSHLPVAIDGSQNVLQHVSAINLDETTGGKVGLINTKFPFDIYLAVGKRIIEHAKEFFALRKMSMKDIRKNISKRSTMVRNYSAGRRSISDNMYRDCVKNDAASKHNITPSDCFMLAAKAMKAIDEEVPANKTFRKYLQQLVKHELGEYSYAFPDNTDAYQNWRKLFASYNTMSKKDKLVYSSISRTLEKGLGNNQVSWTTPTGFPVVQSLNYQVSLPLRPTILGHRKTLQIRFDSEVPNLEKHISAIAANFIHSQDASHAAMTINEVSTKNFMLIHDSFAVHACDVDELVRVAKDTFKRIYDVDENYYNLIKQQILTDASGFTPATPELGELNLDDIDDSDYFFC